MNSKSRMQLLQALQQRQTPIPKDMPQGLVLAPLTATCWAAASLQEVCPGLGGGRPAGCKGAAATAGDVTYAGFDLCIGDGTVHEGEKRNASSPAYLHAAGEYACTVGLVPCHQFACIP
jgi:hypothetical protein